MHSSMLLALVLMLLASTTLLASGRGNGGGQAHASKPHAASPTASPCAKGPGGQPARASSISDQTNDARGLRLAGLG